MAENDFKAVISHEIEVKAQIIAESISKGYTVTIRPTKDGIKVTSHKEKTI